MQTENELLAGLLAVGNGAGKVVKIEAMQDKKNEFAQKHHGMMSGSSIGLIIIEPASKVEIEAKQAEIEAKQAEIYASKTGKTVTKEKELGVLQRALEKMLNGDFSQTAKSYLDKIKCQRRRNFNAERPDGFFGNADTKWGNIKEPEAIAAYEALTGLKLDKTGDNQEFVRLGYVELVDFDFSEWFGCSPDSVTEEITGRVVTAAFDNDVYSYIPREFKNPSSGVVFDRYRDLKTPLDLKKENGIYYWQVIAQMTCLDAPFAQWIAYDCDVINEDERFVIIDFERDLAAEKLLNDSLFKAVQYIEELV
jgi:hypothetical protein